MINQISIANTFSTLVNAVASLITVLNSLTDGPSITANTEFRVPTVNVRTRAVVAGNLTSSVRANASNIIVTGAITVSNTANVRTLTVTNTMNSATIITSNVLISSGNSTLATLNTTSMVSANALIGTLISPASNLTIARTNASFINVMSGTITLTTANISSANITSINQVAIQNSTIRFSNIANSTFSNSTVVSPQGLSKSDFGLGNVDDTSDATKNSATANLYNKTIHSPLIISGNVSSDPSIGTQIASKRYVDNRRETYNGIMNGSMDVWQRGNVFSSLSSGTIWKVADRWKLVQQGNGLVVTVNRSNTVPSVANAGVVFNHSLEVDVTTAESTPGSGNYVHLRHVIDGSRWRHFAQRECTLSFWVMSTKTGIYSIDITNSTSFNQQNRTYIAEYTINSSDTWEYKTITIPASPSDGTWNYTTAQVGAELLFNLSAGSSRTSTPHVWGNTFAKFASSNQVSSLDSTSNFFRLTGVKLELGSSATPIKHISFMDEYIQCKRYFQKSFDYGVTPAQNAGANTGEFVWAAAKAGAVINYSPPIRLSPPMNYHTIILYNPSDTNDQPRDESSNTNWSGYNIFNAGDSAFNLYATGNTSTSVGNLIGVHYTVDADL